MAFTNANTSDFNQTKNLKFQHSNNELIPGLPHDLAIDCLLRLPLTSLPSLRLVSLQWYSTLSHPSFFSLRRTLHLAHNLVFLIQPQDHHQNHHQTSIVEDDNNTNKDEVISTSNNNPLLYNLNIYNTNTNEWRHLGGGPTIPAFSQCVVLPTVAKAVVLGGWDPTTLEPVSKVLVFDLALGTWKEGSPMPTARSFLATAAVSSTVYVAGGHDGQKNALKTAATYDVEADEWRELPSMAEERDESYGMFSQDGKFWVVSGYGTNSQGRFRPDAEVFDPVKQGWETVTGLWPYSGKSPKCTAVVTVEGKRRWWDVVEEEVREFGWEERVWKRVNLGRVSKRVNGLLGLSSSVCLIGVGNGKVMLMGNGGNNGGKEGMFILEKGNEDKEIGDDNLNWELKIVESPSKFLGFPFCATNILM